MTAPRTQDDPLSEFDQLTKKPKGGTDPLAAFDLLVGGGKKRDIVLPEGQGNPDVAEPVASQPAAGRTTGSVFSRARKGVADYLNEKLSAGDPNMRNVIERPADLPRAASPRPHQLEAVVSTAEQPGRSGGLATAISQVLSQTKAGVDTPAPGQEAPFDEATYQTYRTRMFDQYNATNDPATKRDLANRLGQLEKQRSEAMALRKEDPISAAGRSATFGALQTPERYAIRHVHEADIESGRAVTPEELKDRGIIEAGERPHRLEPGETGAQAVGEFAGVLPPFEVGERVGMGAVRRLADAIEVGVPRAKNIAEALRFAESPVTATTEFGQGAQRIAKGAIRGQLGGAAVGAGEATARNQNVGETIKAGIVPYAELGSAFGAAGAGYPTAAGDVQTGAYIADASHMLDATRPDRTPVSDKMPDAHMRTIASLVQRLIGEKTAAMTPDQRLELAQQQGARTRPPEPTITPGSAYRPRVDETAEPDVPLRSARDITLEREGVKPVKPVEQMTSEQLWEQGREERARQLNTPEGQDALAERLLKGKRFDATKEGADQFPVDTRPLHEQLDMSKNLDRVKEEQRIVEEERIKAEEQQAREQSAAEQQKPSTFAEELEAAGKGDAVQRMRDGDLVAYARKIARHTDTVGRQLQKQVWEEIKGRGLDKKVGPAALALAAVAGASQTEDEDKRAALLGAAALTTGREGVHEGRPFYSRLEKHVESLPPQWDKPRTAKEWMEKLESGGPFSKEEYNRVLKPALEAHAEEVKSAGKFKRQTWTLEFANDEPGSKTTDNPDTRDAWKDLYSGRLADGRAKIVENEPGSWQRFEGGELVAEGDDASRRRWERDQEEKPFSMIDIRKVPSIAEKGGKLTKQDVLDMAQENAIELGDTRLTQTGKSIQPGSTAEGPGGTGEGPAVLALRAERAEDAERAQRELDRLDTRMGNLRNDLENEWEKLGGRAHDLHDIIAEQENPGEGINIDKVMSKLQEEDPDAFYPPQPHEPDLPDGLDYERLEPTINEPDAVYRIYQYGGRADETKTVATGLTRFEAMANAADKRGDDTFGNLDELLGPNGKYLIRASESADADEMWEAVDRRHPGSEPDYVGATRDGLVDDIVGQEWEPAQVDEYDADQRIADLRHALDKYDDAYREYYEHESGTYDIREEDPEGENDNDFQRQLEEARDQDEEDAADFVDTTGLRDFDPEFYDLSPEQQDHVREGIERGAVGTISPMNDEGHGVSHEYVFDPELPHTPFPREGVRVHTDPNQLPLGGVFGPFDRLAPPPTVALPAPLAAELKAQGVTKYTTYQRVPGGKNYREILISWDNAPESFNAGHWQDKKENTAAHIRMTEHNYRPSFSLSDKLQDIIDRRTELGEEQRNVLQEYNRLRGGRDDAEMMNDPAAREAAEKYAAINKKVEAVEKQYQDKVQEAKQGPRVEKTLNVFEHQSDWKQRGEESGYRRDLPAGVKLQLEVRSRILANQNIDLNREINKIEDAISRKYDARANESWVAYKAARDAFYTSEVLDDPEFEKRSAVFDAAEKARDKVAEEKTHEQREASRDLRQKRSEVNAELDRIHSELSPNGVADMPWKDNDQVFGLTTARMLVEAAEGNYDRVAWSTSENRHILAGLSKEAARITYDQSVVSATKKLLKGLGFKDVNVEKIKLDGYDHWSVKLTPEMKKAIKKFGFPVLGLLGALSLSKNKEDQGTAAAAMGMAALLVSRKRIPRMTPILEAMRRAPGPLAAAAAATLLAQSSNKDLQNTSAPLYALAILSAIGTKRMALARDVIGKIVIDNMRKSDTGAAAVRFINPDAMLSPEVRRAILDYERTRNKGRARATELSGRASKLGPKGDRAVSDVIENESREDVSNVGPEDMKNIIATAQAISDEFDRLTQAKVRLGVLKPHEAIENYLPRKYAYWEALDVLSENPRQGAMKPGQRPRIAGAKKRTIKPEDIAARDQLGEIREASYRTALGVDQGYADMGAAQLFKLFRNTPGVIHPEFQTALDEFLTAKDMYRTAKQANNAADMSAAEAMMDKADLEKREITRRFKLKGGDFVSMPESKTLGVLSGMVIDRDVANSLNGIPEVRKTDKLLRFWKQSKTVFNPGTHVGNILSNVTMAHMGGMRMTEQPLFLVKAAKDMKNYGPATRALMESGVLDLNYLTAGSGGETGRSFKTEKGLQKLAETTRPETEKVFRQTGLGHAPAEKVPTFKKWMEGTRELYNNEDNIFRVAMFLKARATKKLGFSFDEGGGFGMSHAEAVKKTQDTFANFRSRSPALRMIRGSVAPFILWPAKAVPAFAKNVVDHPVRYMTLMATWGALNEYSKATVGAVPDEDVPEQDRRKYGYFFPGLTQLPFENPRGDHAATDIARWTPMSGATDVSPPGTPGAAFSPNFPRILQPSGPLTDIYGKFVNNVDPFTGKQHYSADYPVKRNIGTALNDILELALPSALGFHRERIMADIDNRDMEALKTDILGPTGLRPRYLRAGANVTNAAFDREKALLDAKQEARRALSRSQSPDRDAEILKSYLEYVDKIEENFQRRALPGQQEEK